MFSLAVTSHRCPVLSLTKLGLLLLLFRMMNIVRAKGNKVRTKLFGGEKALIKHGLTIELLTTTAWECQKKVGRAVGPTAWQNA
jgi:hypothetical protein